jgi:Calx-beta domain
MYSTVDGTAVQGTDYEFTQGTLTWEDGDTSPKAITIPIPQSDSFTGTKQFSVKLSAPSAHASLGSPSVTSVTIVGTLVTKSISEWVKCDGVDDSTGTAAALNAAKNNAFVLIIDCPFKVHFSGNVAKTIAIQDGTTVEFQGDGAITIDNVSPPPLEVVNLQNVTFVNWNVSYP